MLILKILGGILIIGSSALIGFLKSKEFINRTTELRDLACLLQILETEICYMSNVLSDALENCAKARLDSKVGNIFNDTAELLKKRDMTSKEAWDKAVNNNLRYTSLRNDDVDILLNLGNSLGTSDHDGQIKNIRFVLKQLEVQISKSDAESNTYQSMYKKLGLLGGIAVVVILF